jgi:hypothetical protein
MYYVRVCLELIIRVCRFVTVFSCLITIAEVSGEETSLEGDPRRLVQTGEPVGNWPAGTKSQCLGM